MSKTRLTVSIDGDLARAAKAAVAEGGARSLSGWVGEALAEKLARERRLEELAKAVAAYEVEHGSITDEELAEQARADRDAAAASRRAARSTGAR